MAETTLPPGAESFSRIFSSVSHEALSRPKMSSTLLVKQASPRFWHRSANVYALPPTETEIFSIFSCRSIAASKAAGVRTLPPGLSRMRYSMRGLFGNPCASIHVLVFFWCFFAAASVADGALCSHGRAGARARRPIATRGLTLSH